MSSAIDQSKIFLGSVFSTISKMNLSDVLQFLVVCMIISGMKPQTAEWMDEFMSVSIIILQITMNDNFFVFFKELIDRVFNKVKDKLQVEPDECWCNGSSKQCSVCAKKSCYCAGCVGSPCDKFLPAIEFMRKTSYNFLGKISCISIFLSLRFPGRLRSPSDFNTAIVLHNLTHANEFELDRITRSKLLHMSLGIKLTKLLFARFTNSTYGGRKLINRMEKRLISHCLLKSLRKGDYEEKRIPWHNGIRCMNLYSFNYVFFNPNYYLFLVSVALNPNPFRWIFNNWKQFSWISMSIEYELQFIQRSYSWKRERYDIYCQSNFVKDRIVYYMDAILYGNYEENGSFPDFLKRLVRELDLMDPPQDDFNVCIRN
jgi:hypothetical protein